jgi:dCTP deaminase
MTKEYGAILTEKELKNRLTAEDPNRRMFIIPLLSTEQIGRASIDVRLGNEFIAFKRTKYSVFDPLERPEKLTSKVGGFQEKIYVPLGKNLFLHPQQLVLGSTLEYLRLPNDLVAEVVGRSSWGRLGLILSAATLVHPGYAGVITLELANQGDVPIPLVPGTKIAQLVVMTTASKEQPKTEILKSKYIGSVGPTFSKIYEDDDLEVLRQIGERT